MLIIILKTLMNQQFTMEYSNNGHYEVYQRLDANNKTQMQ